MPSVNLGSYCPGSGFVPLFSGNPFSGTAAPVGGVQLYAYPQNSGIIYISYSGGNFFSGQFGTLVGSGGPTITSGSWTLSGGLSSGWGMMDGFPMIPGSALFVPRVNLVAGAFGAAGQNINPYNTWPSFQLCAGCDPACSGGFGRLHVQAD